MSEKIIRQIAEAGRGSACVKTNFDEFSRALSSLCQSKLLRLLQLLPFLVQSQDADLLEQVDRQVVRIRELEQLIHAKSEMLRQMESALERERNSNEPMIRLQADLAQLKTKNQMLEKENNELRRLCGGDRTPKYLPIAAPSPRNSDSDQSPATEEAGIPLAAKSSSASKSPNKSFRKIFGKVKRSNSGGQLTGQEISPPPPDKYGDLKICLDQKGSIGIIQP